MAIASALADLAAQPFIMPPPKFAEQSETMNLFKNVGVVPRVEQEARQTTTTLSLVSAGLGCSVVMATAALWHTQNVRFLRIEDEIPHARWEMAAVWHPERLTEQTIQFLKHVSAYLKENPRLLDLDAYRKWV